MTTTHTLDVPGARVRYEVRGAGPLLLLMGSPMGAAAFELLADELANDHTVLTHDPRGFSGSPVHDPDEDSTPEKRADDVAALIDAAGAESADVFGTSGGAMTVLALAARHPGRVRTVIAHEPPVLEFLPDAAEQRAGVDDIVDTFHRDGPMAAFEKFAAHSGLDTEEQGSPGGAGPSSEQDVADSARFFAHELRATTRYVPDVDALTACPAGVVVGIGADSGGLQTFRTSHELARRLGEPPVEFPGGHTGFLPYPEEFARVLRKVLSTGS
ncbi:alpha/beta fold hydrolase [Amycolatopsis regifaucium]|uniref:Hydrolase n=1 Tax=Amycolatopsis regifaucium TaxID=546365 RepID=A0A154MVC9_9PSEU|nr:alpha/beta hydrolase [Amycolatopsis regifaucium]KZB87449.1 hydrolase [Amycolatopsis regifaucium]OKA08287.1 alpha/beta hydrolase [Amycolatopsis regifaucium]SFI05565.1 Pimeloyl-ACP methyl ester carboxylesterase [Amycolatopsis regifaucium]